MQTDVTISTPAPPATRAAPAAARNLGRLAARAARELTVREQQFAVEFAECGNATLAYEASHPTTGMTRNAVRVAGFRMLNTPHVERFINELLGEAAREAVVDVAEILASDLALVRAYDRHADEITQHVTESCRHCHGIEHKYQWRDLDEYLAALDAAEQDNAARRERKLAPKLLPKDDGGYGFNRSREPHIACPKCEGRGVPAVYFADTTKLTGGARRLVKGVKQGANGQLEILMHDVDKAKERLLKASGAFGDDAASVARAAAAGSAAGAAAAAASAAVAQKVGALSGDDLRRAYLGLVQS